MGGSGAGVVWVLIDELKCGLEFTLLKKSLRILCSLLIVRSSLEILCFKIRCLGEETGCGIYMIAVSVLCDIC